MTDLLPTHPPPTDAVTCTLMWVATQRHINIQRDAGTHAGPHRHTIQRHTHSCRYTQTQIPRYSHRHKYSNRYRQTDMHRGTHIQLHTNQVGMHIMTHTWMYIHTYIHFCCVPSILTD